MALRWISLDPTDNKLTLVPVMAWGHEAITSSHNPVLCGKMASLDHNELTLLMLEEEYSSLFGQYHACWSSASLTHWGRDKMAAVSQTTLSNAFSWMKMLEFELRFHWSLFLRVQLQQCSNIPALVQIMAWRRLGDKPLYEPMLACSPTHICVSRPQWVHSLRLSDAYMRQ